MLTFNSKLNKALSEGVEGDLVIGYHGTTSFHLVKGIFQSGFKDPLKSGLLCFVDNISDLGWEWGDQFGPYVIKFSCPLNVFNLGEHYSHLKTDRHSENEHGVLVLPDEHTGFLDRFESKAPMSSVTPIVWGVYTPNKETREWEAYWFGDNPQTTDLERIIEEVPLTEEQMEVVQNDAGIDIDSDDAAAVNAFRKESNYAKFDNDFYDSNKDKVAALIGRTDNILDAFKMSGLEVAEFRWILDRLKRNEIVPYDVADKKVRGF